MSRGLILASTLLAGLSAAPAVGATRLFDLSVVDPAAGLSASSFGTVKVEESAGSLIFTQTLTAGFRIHDGNGNHNAFAFSLLGDPAITVSNLTAGFTRLGSGVSAPPFGSFDYAIDCTFCGPGYAGGYASPLSFKVTASSGTLSLASLQSNAFGGKNIFFTTDLVNSAGRTGNVGAVLLADAVPETATWAMFLGGFGAIGGAMRRQRPRPRYA